MLWQSRNRDGLGLNSNAKKSKNMHATNHKRDIQQWFSGITVYNLKNSFSIFLLWCWVWWSMISPNPDGLFNSKKIQSKLTKELLDPSICRDHWWMIRKSKCKSKHVDEQWILKVWHKSYHFSWHNFRLLHAARVSLCTNGLVASTNFWKNSVWWKDQNLGKGHIGEDS